TAGVIRDIIRVDVNMPETDVVESAEWLSKNHPDIRVLMLTMFDSEVSLLRLLQLGVRGFLKKDIEPSELKFAIQSVASTGYYYSNHTTGRIVNFFRNTGGGTFQTPMLTDQERRFRP